MIDVRNPRTDDPVIFKLIEHELLPITRKTFPHIVMDQRGIKQRLNEGTTFVIRNRRMQTIGFVHVFTKDKSVWIDMLAIDRRYRKQGLGHLLMRRAEQYGKSRKCTKAFLYVDQINWNAQMFYQKHSYEPVRYEQKINCYIYSKPIV